VSVFAPALHGARIRERTGVVGTRRDHQRTTGIRRGRCARKYCAQREYCEKRLSKRRQSPASACTVATAVDCSVVHWRYPSNDFVRGRQLSRIRGSALVWATEGFPTLAAKHRAARSGADNAGHARPLIAQNLKLTDAEATKFWPIYDQYTAAPVDGC
jgi:hypothetical protein